MGTVLAIALIVIFIICKCIFGCNEAYCNKSAKRKATEIKVFLEHIDKMENEIKIEKLISLYPIVKSEYFYLSKFKETNTTAYLQCINLGRARYQTIHKKPTSLFQNNLLNLYITFEDFYSQCIISLLSRYCDMIEVQVKTLKTNSAKEKRRTKITEYIQYCVSELNQNGDKEYIYKISELVERFDIHIDVKKSSEYKNNDIPFEYVHQVEV